MDWNPEKWDHDIWDTTLSWEKYIKTMHPKGTKKQHISTQKGNGATPDPSQEPCILPPSPLQTTNKEVYKSKQEDAKQRESWIHTMRRESAHL